MVDEKRTRGMRGTLYECSQKEAQILDFCKQYIEENGFSPSYREIGDGVNIASTQTIKDYMDRLRARGEIIGPTNTPRAFRLKSMHTGKDFIIDRAPGGREKTNRTMQICDDIYERLKTFENAYGQYTKSAVVNQLLHEALTKYGY